MQNYKQIVLSLALLTLPMVHGCTPKESNSKEVSTLESKLYAELKDNNGSYRSILGEATSDEEIVAYDNVNLVSVKIINQPDVSKIKLFYDESLLKVSIYENYFDPVYGTAYEFARKNKILKPEVELYVEGKLLRF